MADNMPVQTVDEMLASVGAQRLDCGTPGRDSLYAVMANLMNPTAADATSAMRRTIVAYARANRRAEHLHSRLLAACGGTEDGITQFLNAQAREDCEGAEVMIAVFTSCYACQVVFLREGNPGYHTFLPLEVAEFDPHQRTSTIVQTATAEGVVYFQGSCGVGASAIQLVRTPTCRKMVLGSQFVDTLQFRGGTPPYDVSWRNQNGELQHQTLHHASASTYRKVLALEDSGAYSVHVEDSLGNANFVTFSLVVHGDALPGDSERVKMIKYLHNLFANTSHTQVFLPISVGFEVDPFPDVHIHVPTSTGGTTILLNIYPGENCHKRLERPSFYVHDPTCRAVSLFADCEAPHVDMLIVAESMYLLQQDLPHLLTRGMKIKFLIMSLASDGQYTAEDLETKTDEELDAMVRRLPGRNTRGRRNGKPGMWIDGSAYVGILSLAAAPPVAPASSTVGAGAAAAAPPTSAAPTSAGIGAQPTRPPTGAQPRHAKFVIGEPRLRDGTPIVGPTTKTVAGGVEPGTASGRVRVITTEPGAFVPVADSAAGRTTQVAPPAPPMDLTTAAWGTVTMGFAASVLTAVWGGMRAAVQIYQAPAAQRREVATKAGKQVGWDALEAGASGTATGLLTYPIASALGWTAANTVPFAAFSVEVVRLMYNWSQPDNRWSQAEVVRMVAKSAITNGGTHFVLSLGAVATAGATMGVAIALASGLLISFLVDTGYAIRDARVEAARREREFARDVIRSYQILGIDATDTRPPTAAKLTARHRQLQKLVHPDRTANSVTSTEIFQTVQRAHEFAKRHVSGAGANGVIDETRLIAN